MATASLPTSGSYPVALSPGLFPSTAKKRKRDEGEMIAFKYAFKPASMSSSTETTISPSQRGSKTLRADTTSHGTQVFDVREEQSKSRECVLVYDETTNTFSLHALPTTIHLTLNRAASSTSSRSRPSRPESPSASSTSSSSQPLAQKRRPEDPVTTATTTTRQPASRPSSQSKKPRQSELPLPDRPTKGGKALPPRPPPPSSAASPPKPPAPLHAAPASGKGKGKNGAKKPPPPTKKSTTKKATPKAPIVPQGKYKSAEIIEDSDDEYDLGSAPAETTGSQPPVVDVEEEDEFAKMLAEGLSEQQHQQAYDEDEDEDDEDEDDEEEDDDELGGARLAVRQSAPSTSGFGNGESEWL